MSYGAGSHPSVSCHPSQGPGDKEAGSAGGDRMGLKQLDDRRATVTLGA